MTTVTANYGWQMPDPGGSANTWGNTLNATTQAIDAQMLAAVQGGAPIGSITMFGGRTTPANWLICDGGVYSTSAPYDKLFAVISTIHGSTGPGNFAVPNLQAAFPVGAGTSSKGAIDLGSAGGSYWHTIDIVNMPVHAHGITDVAHNHYVNDPTHAHSVSDGGHSHGAFQDAHNHTIPNVGLASGVNIQPGSGFNMVNTATTSTAQPVVHINSGGTGIGIYGAATGVYLSASGTGLYTTQAAGSGVALNVVPPFVGLNFIIRYQ